MVYDNKRRVISESSINGEVGQVAGRADKKRVKSRGQ